MNVVSMRPSRSGVARMLDSFESFLSGLGMFGRDKGVTTIPHLRVLSQKELQDLYRGDWLSRKICDVPAFDACRAWRSWQAEQDQIEALQEAERKYGLQRKLMGAITRARLYGGSAIIIGVDDRGRASGAKDALWKQQCVDQSRQIMKDAGNNVMTVDKAVQGADFLSALDLDKVGKDDLKFIHVVERWMIAAGPVVRDITSPWFGEPNYYMRANTPIIPAPGGVEQLPGAGNWGVDPSATIYIHPSRVVRLIGHEYPDVEMSPDAWGDSVLQTVYEAVKDANTVAQSIANLTTRANTNVIRTPGLINNLSTSTGTQVVTNRFANANAAQSVVNAILLDKDEEWLQLQVQFGSLPQVLQMYLMIASGAADIPATRLLGREPAGQNATGESDLRNYYDRLSAEQEVKYKPLLSPLDEVLIRNTFGTRDPNINYNWNPLWQLAPDQKADVGFKKAQAFKIDADSGLIPAEALAKARENQLIEDGVYPGLESALEEAELEMEAEDVPEDEDGGAGGGGGDDLDPGDVDATQTEEAMNRRPAQDDLPGGGQSALSFQVPLTRGRKRGRSFNVRSRALNVRYPPDPDVNYGPNDLRVSGRRALYGRRKAVGDDKDEFGHGSERRGGAKPKPQLWRGTKAAAKEAKSKWRAHALKVLAHAEKWAAKYNAKHSSKMGMKATAGVMGYAGPATFGDDDQDAVVGSMYVNRPVLNAADIIRYYKDQGLETTLPADDMHVTVAFSREPVDWMKFMPNNDQILVDGGPRYMERFGDNGEALVLQFSDMDLQGRWQYLCDNGASWDWPNYNPHITISHNAGDKDVQPYTGPILLGPEEFAPVPEDWRSGITEDDWGPPQWEAAAAAKAVGGTAPLEHQASVKSFVKAPVVRTNIATNVRNFLAEHTPGIANYAVLHKVAIPAIEGVLLFGLNKLGMTGLESTAALVASYSVMRIAHKSGLTEKVAHSLLKHVGHALLDSYDHLSGPGMHSALVGVRRDAESRSVKLALQQFVDALDGLVS